MFAKASRMAPRAAAIEGNAMLKRAVCRHSSHEAYVLGSANESFDQVPFRLS